MQFYAKRLDAVPAELHAHGTTQVYYRGPHGPYSIEPVTLLAADQDRLWVRDPLGVLVLWPVSCVHLALC